MTGSETPGVKPLNRDIYIIDGKLVAADDRQWPRTMLLLLNPSTHEAMSVRPTAHSVLTTDAHTLELERLKQDAGLSEAELLRMRSSLSWRITRPLRAARTRLRKLRASLAQFGRGLFSR